MDVYQIFITHNRRWTIWETFCFSVIFVAAFFAAYRLVSQKKIVRPQAASGLLLLVFLGIVFGSTVFTRTPNGIHDYELEVFWSWKSVFAGNREILKENLLNMILLIPMGFLLPGIFHKSLSWKMGLLAGVIVSGVIETCQLIFCRGLFEWDDMIHNGIGCMIGCMIGSWFMAKCRHIR